MFDVPMDGLIGWLGLATVSFAVAGVALSLPSTTPPDAGALASSIDQVSTSPHEVATSVRLRADAVRVRSAQVSVRKDGVVTHADLVAGGALWTEDDRLRGVLAGKAPDAVFEDSVAFGRAIDGAAARPVRWRSVPDPIRVRRVTWGGVDVTIVG
jgi:hypothetical protein